MSSTFLVPILALVLLYFWLRGWWFAGLIAGFLYCFWDTNNTLPEEHRSYWITALVACGPWFFWHALRDHQRKQNRELAAHAASMQASQVYGPEVYSIHALFDADEAPSLWGLVE